jgi:hypothetical protein
LLGVPSMNIDLEVEVLWEVGRNDASEPQGADREGSAESSGERDLRVTNRNRIGGNVVQLTRILPQGECDSASVAPQTHGPNLQLYAGAAQLPSG